MYKVVKWHADERADLGDMEQATAMLDLWEGVRANRVFSMPEGRNTGTAPTEARILGGFDIDLVNDASIGGAGYCRLNRGGGFFKVVKEGETKLGLLVGDEGQVYQILDLSAGAPGTDYAVWVRANYQDASSENRVFWNSGATEEYVDYVATREECVWEYDVRAWSAPSPGDEWVKIWKVPVVAGPAIGTIVDYRHFYFEGDAAAVYAHEWGTGNDRNANRSLYGIQDMHNFVCAIRKKIEDIQGASYQWWEVPSVDLTDLDAEHKADGSHSDVTCDSMAITPPVVVPPTTIPASARKWWIANENGSEILRIERHGRLARPHHFYDDFHYRNNTWGTVPSADYGHHYSAALVGAASRIQIPSAAVGVERVGGWAHLETDTNPADSAMLYGNPNWEIRPANTVLYFWSKIRIHTALVTTVRVRVGLQDDTGAWMFWHELDTALAATWKARCDDGAGGTSNTDTTVAGVAGELVSSWFVIDPFNNVFHTHIESVALGLGSGDTTAAIPAGTFTGLMQMAIQVQGVAGGQTHMLMIDAWEAWDELLMSGIAA